jgi:putative salt-induced outer membrane protein
MSMLKSSIGIAALCGGLLVPKIARADGPAAEPAGTVGAQDPATTGTTELEGTGKFGTAADKAAATAEDVTEADVSLGGLLSTGNARAASLTVAGKTRIKRKRNQFSAAFAGNYGRAALDADSDPETTVGNVQGRLRYDYFVHDRISLFAMVTARHDPFQGLQARVNVDPGVAFYLIDDGHNRLWTEVGYDFQYDRFERDATFARDDTGEVLFDASGEPVIAIDRERYNHAVRLFGGYENHLTEAVSFATGLEYLQSVQVARRWRVNWDVQLAAQLINRLAIGLTFTARMDNDPAPSIRKVDTITAVSLIYRFF